MLALICAAVILIQTPAVQTGVSKAVTDKLQENLDADISFSKISLRPFHTLVIRDLAVVDREPALPPDDSYPEPYDTLMKAEYVVASFTLDGLMKALNGEALQINNVSVRNGRFHLVTEEGEGASNLARMFHLKKKEEGAPKNMNDLFWIKKIKLSGYEYSMHNYRAPRKQMPEGCIDWQDLHVQNINAEGSNLRMNKAIITATLEKLNFTEKSGYVSEQLSASCAGGNMQAVIQDIRIKDPWSDVRLPHFIMSWSRKGDFKAYVEKVGMDFQFDQTKLSSQTLGYFVPAVKKMDLEVVADGSVCGPVGGLEFDKFKIKTSDGSFALDLNGWVDGLPVLKETNFDLSLDNCNTTARGLENLIRGVTGNKDFKLGIVRPETRASLRAKVSGEMNDLDAGLTLASGVGDVKADVNVKNVLEKDKRTEILGDLESDELELGLLLDSKLLGKLSLQSTLGAVFGGDKGPELDIKTIEIEKLGLNGYDYTDIFADGELSLEGFQGRIISQDPALLLDFDGLVSFAPKKAGASYRFNVGIAYADLYKMGLDEREGSAVSFALNADFKEKQENLVGTLDINNLSFENGGETYDIGNISTFSSTENGAYKVSLDSEFLDGIYEGSKPITDFFADLTNISVGKELPALYNKEFKEWDGSTYGIQFQFKDPSTLAAFLKPGLYIDSDSSLGLDIDEAGEIRGWVKSHRLALKENYLKDLDLEFDNADDNITAELNCTEISLASILMKDDNVRIFVNDNEFGLGLSFDNGDDMVSDGEFIARGDLFRDEDDRLCVDIGILPSGFHVNSEEWSIMPAEIGFRGKSIRVDGVQFTNGEQAIFIDGGLSSESRDTLDVDLERFNLSALNPFIGKTTDYDLRGYMTGSAMLTSNGEEQKGILMDFLVDSTAFAGTYFGTVLASSNWNEPESSFDIGLYNDCDGKRSLDATARYFPQEKQLKAAADLDSQDITCMKDLITGVFEEVEGSISGRLELEGPLDSLELSTKDTRLTAKLTIDYTNVPYTVDGPFHADSKGLYFDDIPLQDEYRGSGTLGGGVYWNHFKDIQLGIHIDARNIEAIAKAENEGDGFYCNAFGTGTVDITGPLTKINIDVDMITSDRSKFGLLLASSGKNANSGMLNFKEPEVDVTVDPYEEMMGRLRQSEKAKNKGNGVDVHLQIHANPQIEAMLEIDPDTGSAVSGRGNGLIDATIRPDEDIYLKGDYTLDEGNFYLNLMGIASRNFTINEGSSIRFNGEVNESDLDIDAIYKTKASISTLIGDTTSVNSRRNVDCYLKLGGKLKEPQLSFDIQIADLEPSVKAKVENALSTEDKVQKQVIALLLTNNFLADEQSGVNNNAASSALYSNAANILTNQLNNILSKLNIPLDLGLNYQQNTRGNDVFDVNVSTQLFNNRVVINGNIGNRQYSSSSNSDVAGDIDIEIKLDQSGTFRLNLFSHSSDQYTNYLDNSQRNGLGVTYQQEFNKFSEIFKYMFAGRKKREQLDAEEIQRQQEEGLKTIVVE